MSSRFPITGKKVLVVDDEKFVRDLIRIKLEHIGIAVIEADNGNSALEITERELPDLILLDVMMPQMNGFDVCNRLKASPKTSGIPVIMLTARGEKENRQKGIAAGAEDYLIKPFSPQNLAERVVDILSAG